MVYEGFNREFERAAQDAAIDMLIEEMMNKVPDNLKDIILLGKYWKEITDLASIIMMSLAVNEDEDKGIQYFKEAGVVLKKVIDFLNDFISTHKTVTKKELMFMRMQFASSED